MYINYLIFSSFLHSILKVVLSQEAHLEQQGEYVDEVLPSYEEVIGSSGPTAQLGHDFLSLNAHREQQSLRQNVQEGQHSLLQNVQGGQQSLWQNAQGEHPSLQQNFQRGQQSFDYLSTSHSTNPQRSSSHSMPPSILKPPSRVAFKGVRNLFLILNL